MDPFTIDVQDSDLADLRDRLARVRWALEPSGGDAGYGVAAGRVRELVRYWRVWERRLNQYPQFTTTIDGTNVHFPHVRSREFLASHQRVVHLPADRRP